MKNIFPTVKESNEGSAVVEVGSHESAVDDNNKHINSATSEMETEKSHNEEVEVLKELLSNQGKGFLIKWLQEILLATCRVKLSEINDTKKIIPFLEPIPYHYNNLHQSIPLVPWSKQQERHPA